MFVGISIAKLAPRLSFYKFVRTVAVKRFLKLFVLNKLFGILLLTGIKSRFHFAYFGLCRYQGIKKIHA